MKLLLHYPKWGNRWEPYVIEALKDFDLTISHETDPLKLGDVSYQQDILLSMWATDVVKFWTQEFSEKKIVTYLRRFELWEKHYMEGPDWSAVDKIIFVSNWCREMANSMWDKYNILAPSNQVVIPNGLDLDTIPFRQKKPNSKKIAFVCSLKEVKNVPLAFQILKELPEEYTLHHIGLPFRSQDLGQLFSYSHSLGLSRRFFTDWQIPRDEVYSWLEDKDFILSTSINEGNPNNIIEGMAMGIKPIIHSWPGARDQFPNDLIFDRILGAVDLITGRGYDPNSYSDWVASRYGLSNFEKLTEAIKELI